MDDRSSRSRSRHQDGRLEITALVAIERSVAGDGKTVQHRKPARDRRLHFFQSFFNGRFRLGESAFVAGTLGVTAPNEQRHGHQCHDHYFP
jgi:hypothetical protein